VEDISLCSSGYDGHGAHSAETIWRLSTVKSSKEQNKVGTAVLKTIHEPVLPITLTPNQVRGFWAAWGGLVLDGMDSFIYALVLVPAMRDLLPRSGIEPTIGNLGFYGSILFSIFLVGWGCAFLWGPIADRFGRVRALMLAILCYSVFTFLGCMAQNIWQLGGFRFLAGFGVGGEFVGAAVFVAEELPGGRRVSGAGYLNTGYYAGIFLAAALNYLVGTRFGWRAMFAVGLAPALFIAYIRYHVHEPERWTKRIQTLGTWKARDSFLALFSPEYRRRTTLNCIFVLVSMIGLWAGSVYVPGAVTQIALRQGHSSTGAARIASWATMLLATGTILGCLIMAPLANWLGRRGALAFYYSLMAASISTAFGYAFYPGHGGLPAFITALFFVGIGGGSFAVQLLWLPEQYRSECRGSALAFATCIGRFVAAAGTLIVGAGIARYGSIGVPVALTSLAFVFGLLFIPLGIETRNQPLPV
jgi:MFS family permease